MPRCAGHSPALPPLVYLGRISYGVYLLHNFSHIPVRLAADFLHVPALHAGAIGTLLQLAATLVAASLSWRFFESPLNSLKRYFPYHGESSPQVDPAYMLSTARFGLKPTPSGNGSKLSLSVPGLKCQREFAEPSAIQSTSDVR